MAIDVKWHPIKVKSNGQIIAGERPPENSYVYVTIKRGLVRMTRIVFFYIYDCFVDGWFRDRWQDIIAWAEIPEPEEPYRKLFEIEK